MARALRIEFPGAVYHVASRGNTRQDIDRDDRDREKWVDWLRRTVETYNCWAPGYRVNDASRAMAAYLARRRFGHPAGKVADALARIIHHGCSFRLIFRGEWPCVWPRFNVSLL